jgi:uncharacterized repeat protein (TIGR01451 family)
MSFPRFPRFQSSRNLAVCAVSISLALLVAVFFFTPKAAVQSADRPNKPQQPRPESISGELLVRFRSDAAMRSARKYNRLEIDGREIQIHIESLDAADVLEGLSLARVDPEETMSVMAELNTRPDVLYAEPNFSRHLLVSPNDPLYSNLWGLHNTGVIFGNAGFTLPGVDIDAEPAWNITTGSRNVVVGVVDGGIDVNHPDLHDNIWRNPSEIPGNGLDDDGNGFVDDVNGFDFFHNQGNVFDSGGGDVEAHGTHVAGTIGAIGNNGIGVVGVNWQVSIMSLKIFGRSDESPVPSSVSILVRAYAYAKKMRDLWVSSGGTKGANIRVLNNSIGGYGRSQAEFDAVRALNDSGILFVAAAGNDTRNNDVFPIYPAGYDVPNVISVAASSLADTLTSFTNVGARTVTLSAPGQSIQSTTPFGTYSVMSGTSMASPMVAGSAALLCAAYPNLSVSRLRAALIYNGDSVPSQQYKTLTGRRLNVFNALNAVAENDFTPPASISDFRIVSQSGRSITLGWTAPGDDGKVGTTSLYDIRYSDGPIDSAELFNAATTISPLAIPVPSVAGTLESAIVEVPFGHTTGFIGLKATDNTGNDSAIAVVPVSVNGSFNAIYDVKESAPQALTTGGTQLQDFGPLTPDEGFSDYTLPFAFPFYGHWLRNVSVSINGAVYFSTPPKFLLPPLTGNGIPLDSFSSVRALQTNMMIAGMWDDLIISGVYAVTPDPNRIIFRWEGTTFDTKFEDGTSRGLQPISFELELRRDGTIQVRYGDGNTRLFPVVGISGGGPDAYVVYSHTSESAFVNLTNANTVTFSPRFTADPTSADLQVALSGQSVIGGVPSGGTTSTVLPAAVVPGQILEYDVLVSDLGPDPSDNVVLTSRLPSGTTFVGCSNGTTCSGPPPGTDGGTVTVNFGTIGKDFNSRLVGAGFQVRVNATAGTTLLNQLSVSSSTTDANLTNNSVTATTLVANFTPFNEVLAVDGARLYTIALKQDGTVWMWGIPFGSVESSDYSLTTPKRVDGLSGITQIAAGNSHAIGLRSDGTVWTWGMNDRGQLGNQAIASVFLAFPPTQVLGLTNIQSVAAGFFCSFALAADGSLWAWGGNDAGQLGDGTTLDRSAPVHLNTLSSVRFISSGQRTSYAIKQDGTAWSWGDNNSGLLGTGTSGSFSAVPTQISGLTNARAIVSKFIHAVAVKGDGTVWAWGNGGVGQLGNGGTNDSYSPLQVPGLAGFTAVAAGDSSCLALKSDGTVWFWGDSQRTPLLVTGLAGVKSIGAWTQQYAAIMPDTTVQMWGFNGYGGLGDGTLIGRSSPAPVEALQVVAPPVISPDSSSLVFPRDVMITCETAGALIHYTTNGDDPTEADPIIGPGGSVRVDHSLLLKAKGWKSGSLASRVTSAAFTLVATGNLIDEPWSFVRQHYRDFLNRESDPSGLDFWINEITSCGIDQSCVEVKRINVSASFFLSIEFQRTGYLVERIYKSAYGDSTASSTWGRLHQLPVPVIRLNEFLADTQTISGGVIVGQVGWEQVLENNTRVFASQFVSRARFTTAFPATLTPTQFVDSLNTNAGGPLSASERAQLIGDLTTGAKTRADVLRAVAEDSDLNSAEFNRAFVLMEYFGYLRRNPSDVPDTDYTGYDFWLTKLNQFNGNFIDAEMVKAFLNSAEYRKRFGP